MRCRTVWSLIRPHPAIRRRVVRAMVRPALVATVVCVGAGVWAVPPGWISLPPSPVADIEIRPGGFYPAPPDEADHAVEVPEPGGFGVVLLSVTLVGLAWRARRLIV
jgi:hypothetical protein